MRISCIHTFVLLTGIVFLGTCALTFAASETPRVPETAVSAGTTTNALVLPEPKALLNELTKSDDYPVELLIPSIGLDYRVIQVGINSAGEMDVPDGSTKNVGWYESGTVPGNVGSAVFDAHVFAAFKKLRNVKIADDIYVVTRSGERLHFRAEDSRVYTLKEVPVDKLFNGADAVRLNLITCAGKLTRDKSTYDHRLIVYARLVDE